MYNVHLANPKIKIKATILRFCRKQNLKNWVHFYDFSKHKLTLFIFLKLQSKIFFETIFFIHLGQRKYFWKNNLRMYVCGILFRPEYNYHLISDRRVKSNPSPFYSLHLIPQYFPLSRNPQPHPPSFSSWPSSLAYLAPRSWALAPGPWPIARWPSTLTTHLLPFILHPSTLTSQSSTLTSQLSSLNPQPSSLNQRQPLINQRIHT